jgi:hypothetical protein
MTKTTVPTNGAASAMIQAGRMTMSESTIIHNGKRFDVMKFDSLNAEATAALNPNKSDDLVSNAGGEPPERPRFAPGLVIDKDCLVIDLEGVAWWIRPQVMRIFRVDSFSEG